MKAILLAALAGLATAANTKRLTARQAAGACPDVHVFGARETTAPPGFGTAGPVVDSILKAFPGATSEAIDYPAAGDDQYAASVQAGVKAVVNQVDSFVAGCPDTQVVFVGYSQGGQIMDDAICGGGDPNFGVTDTKVPLSAASVNAVKAVILMGDPRHTPGLPFNVGTSTAPGVSRISSQEQGRREALRILTDPSLLLSSPRLLATTPSSVRRLTSSNSSVTKMIHSARMEMIPRFTRATLLSLAQTL